MTARARGLGRLDLVGASVCCAARPSRLRFAALEARPARARPSRLRFATREAPTRARLSRLRFAALEARPALARPSRLRSAALEARPARLGRLVYGSAVWWARRVDRD